MKEFYILEDTSFFDNFSSLTQAMNYIDSNIEIEKRLRLLTNTSDRYVRCMYEYLVYQGTATFPQLYSWFRQFYLKEQEEPITERTMRLHFRDKFSIMEVFGIISHEIVTGQKGTQNFYVAPFCTEEQYNKATTKFKKYRDYIELSNKVFYDREKKKDTKPSEPIELITCGAFSVSCKEQIPNTEKYCAEHIKVFA